MRTDSRQNFTFMLNKARMYPPGTFVNENYEGYQEGNQIAYYFGDDQYVWFIETAVTRTEYRWRSHLS